jgi:hypothetical protein
MDANFCIYAQGRSWTLIFVFTLMDAHFWIRVGDLDPKFFQGRDREWVAKKYPIAIETRSRPELNDRVEIF